MILCKYHDIDVSAIAALKIYQINFKHFIQAR